jgi:hypothetical protein
MPRTWAEGGPVTTVPVPSAASLIPAADRQSPLTARCRGGPNNQWQALLARVEHHPAPTRGRPMRCAMHPEAMP